jgi:uncharacterized protein (DUF1697 family)
MYAEAEKMETYIILIRGINVGGKNALSMADLRKFLEEQGFMDVSTYIASGNVILRSDKPANEIRDCLEKGLPENFKFDDEFIKVLVLTSAQFQAVVVNKPEGFGEQPDQYHSDAIFLMDIDAAETMSVFSPREGVDCIWPGEGVIYSQRLSALRTKSRLNKIMGSPAYKSMTIRSWNTVVKLREFIRKMGTE